MNELITCICASYNRPRLLGNAIAMFLAQDYPNKRLVILEDSGVLGDCTSETLGYKLISTSSRMPSVAHKRNFLIKTEGSEFISCWDDDDWYFPWHLSAAANCLQNHHYTQPREAYEWKNGTLERYHVYGSYVLSRLRDNNPQIESEAVDCCYAAQWAFRKEAFDGAGGYPEDHGNGEDTVLGRKLFNLYGPSGDPIEPEYPPSYVYSRDASGSWHASDMGRGLSYQSKIGRMPKASKEDFVIELPKGYDAFTKYNIPKETKQRKW